MSFLIAGDTHGTLDLAKVVQYYDGRDAEFSKDEDYLIILGDVGVCGFSASDEAATRATLLLLRYPDSHPCSACFAGVDLQ